MLSFGEMLSHKMHGTQVTECMAYHIIIIHYTTSAPYIHRLLSVTLYTLYYQHTIHTQVHCIMYYNYHLSTQLIQLCIGAGGGLFLTYSTYMKRSQGAVKLGSTIPGINNLVRYYAYPVLVNELLYSIACALSVYSLVCGMTIFCNVFSFEYLKGSSLEVIVDVLKTNGPFNTGITFIQSVV